VTEVPDETTTGVDDADPAVGAVDLVAIGKVGPARGIRGEVFVEPWTDAPDERFAPGAEVLTRASSTLVVAASSTGGGKLVVRFEGVADRPAAEALRGSELFVPRTARPALADPDEYYDTDLIGLRARHVDGTELGPVADVVHAGGADYLVVTVAGRDRLVPFVAAIVPAVDVGAGTVSIDPPDGLFDL
jgi:16S rRNA processing protein RimM